MKKVWMCPEEDAQKGQRGKSLRQQVSWHPLFCYSPALAISPLFLLCSLWWLMNNSFFFSEKWVFPVITAATAVLYCDAISVHFYNLDD